MLHLRFNSSIFFFFKSRIWKDVFFYNNISTKSNFLSLRFQDLIFQDLGLHHFLVSNKFYFVQFEVLWLFLCRIFPQSMFPVFSVSKECLFSIRLFLELTNFNMLCFKHCQLYLPHISTNHVLLIGQNNLNMCLFLWTRSQEYEIKQKMVPRLGEGGSKWHCSHNSESKYPPSNF